MITAADRYNRRPRSIPKYGHSYDPDRNINPNPVGSGTIACIDGVVTDLAKNLR